MHESQVALRSARARQSIATSVAAMATVFDLEEDRAKSLLTPVSLRHGRDVAMLFELERLAQVLGEMAEKVGAPVLEEGLDKAGLPDSVGEALVEAGYDTPEKLRRATDDQLLEIDGIGDARLAQIRAVHPFEPEPAQSEGEPDDEQAEGGQAPADAEPVDGAGQPVVEGVSQGDALSPAEEQEKALAESDNRPRPAAPPDDASRTRRGR
jgi:hypothetical protein